MWLVPRPARLNVVGFEPKGSKCNLNNLECRIGIGRIRMCVINNSSFYYEMSNIYPFINVIKPCKVASRHVPCATLRCRFVQKCLLPRSAAALLGCREDYHRLDLGGTC